MPELPEVESVCRLMRRVLVNHVISEAEVPPDEIVLCGRPPEVVQQAITGRTVTAIGRRGKFWWLEFESAPWLFGHLGMSGWIRHLHNSGIRLHSHGKAPMEDSDGRPRFLKLLLTTDGGERIAFTDGRRLGRLWLGESAELEPQVARLGPDAFDAGPDGADLAKRLKSRKAPIKALLLDQSIYAGLGNYLVDEILYQARIAPARPANSLTSDEFAAMAESMSQILSKAVEVDADYEHFPETWLFHHRWGGGKGSQMIEGRSIVRETIGGRTTAWVPEIQR